MRGAESRERVRSACSGRERHMTNEHGHGGALGAPPGSRRDVRHGTSRTGGLRRGALFALALAAGSLALASCGKREAEQIKLPATPILSAEEQWGVVNYDHLRIRDHGSLDGKALLTIRKGDEVEVLNRAPDLVAIDDVQGYWYYVNYRGLRGWVFGAYLNLYDSKQKADDAAKGTD